MKRAIYLEAYEIETVAYALERAAETAHSSDTTVVITGKRELKRIARMFRATLEPKPEKAP